MVQRYGPCTSKNSTQHFLWDTEDVILPQDLSDVALLHEAMPLIIDINASLSLSQLIPNIKDESSGKERAVSLPDKIKMERQKLKKRRNRKVSLWKFLYQSLLDANYVDLIRWVDREEMTFRVVDSAALARKWGLKKNNNDMTYDKMSRGMRDYDKDTLEKVPNQKLTFKFGKRIKDETSNI